jgi:DNA invertase Pin-like site-specific DNA recombinase
MTTAAVYVRISQDREGAGLGLARQEEDCAALCDRLGWTVADVYADNDVSAYSGKTRPEWQRLLDDVKAGAVDAIAVWHVDRLTRSPVELEHVIDLADRHGLKLATVTGDVDLATPTGRMIARILGATARQEAEHKGERQKRQRRQAAEAGKPNGGGTRPYGYEADRVTIVAKEAEIIREAARRAIAGESLSSISRDFAARGITTPKGGNWQPRTLRRLLASARISGRREHTPRATRDNGTRPLLGDIVADAVWPAIISSEDSDRLRAILSDPDRQRFSSANGRTYLLSGILRCGRCGGAMCGRPRSGVPRYVCPNLPGGETCGGTATNAEHTDEHVRDVVLVALSSPELADRLRERDDVDPELPTSIRADEARLEELASAWAAGEITRGEWRVARDIIEGRLDRNRTRLAHVSATAPIDTLMGADDLLGRWEQMNTSQRRAVVAAVIERVDVNPSNPRKRWDPGRFHPVWRA